MIYLENVLSEKRSTFFEFFVYFRKIKIETINEQHSASDEKSHSQGKDCSPYIQTKRSAEVTGTKESGQTEAGPGFETPTKQFLPRDEILSGSDIQSVFIDV